MREGVFGVDDVFDGFLSGCSHLKIYIIQDQDCSFDLTKVSVELNRL